MPLTCLLFILQSNLAVAASIKAGEQTNGKILLAASTNSSITAAAGNYPESAFSWFKGENLVSKIEAIEPLAASAPMPPSAITDAAVSLNGGKIDGSLRVLSGESYNFNSTFQLTGDLYTIGTPTVTVNSGASRGGVVSDGGNANPTNYGITLNSGAILPGKIHRRADAIALPPDIPTSVPNPSGTRYVNINSPSCPNRKVYPEFCPVFIIGFCHKTRRPS